MDTPLQQPYIIFYGRVSYSGHSFKLNQHAQRWQLKQGWFVEKGAWKGDLIVAKYSDNTFTEMIDMCHADAKVIKDYISVHSVNTELH